MGVKRSIVPNVTMYFLAYHLLQLLLPLLIQKRILLTRSVGWLHPCWRLIAGHVKSGESAEKAAIREVQEEVGLELFDLYLLKTYPLKNRNLLMIRFKAKTQQMHIEKSKELENAAWFQLSEPLPLRPNSIASQVVAASQK